MAQPHPSHAQNIVTTDPRGIIVTTMRGPQDAESIDALYEQLAHHIHERRAHNQPVLLLTDISQLRLSDSSSSARLAAKKILALSADASAVIGSSALVGLIMYMLRITGATDKVRFFHSEHRARAWLYGTQRTGKPRSALGLIAGISIGLLGISALLGFWLNNSLLIRWSPVFWPMSPLAAAALLIIAAGFISYWAGTLRVLRLGGYIGVVFGSLMLLPWQLVGAPQYLLISTDSALCFLLMGIVALVAGRRQRWVTLVELGAVGLMIVLALGNIFAQLYAYDWLRAWWPFFGMPLNLAAAFGIAAAAVSLLVMYRRSGDVVGKISWVGWLICASLVIVQVATYVSWQNSLTSNRSLSATAFQNNADDIHRLVQQRLTTYTNALRGFRGLFVSSNDVTQGEFEHYYDATRVAEQYPGLLALSFIRRVDDSQLPQFVAEHRRDTSLHAQGNPSFTIINKSAQPIHYIVTYVADSNSSGGTDLGSNAERLAAFRTVEASGQPVASGTVTFAATATQPERQGFFITIPVAYASETHPTVGFVNAVFIYKDFFANVLPASTYKDLSVTMTDPGDHSTVLSNRHDITHVTYRSNTPITVADRTWQLQVNASDGFGLTQREQGLPLRTLVSGQILSVLLIGVFIVQSRGRRQALDLADRITEDLQHERNDALANDEKSRAILTSIGDGVFAIDTRERITLLNPAAAAISGYSEHEALGRPYHEVLKFEAQKTGKTSAHFITAALDGHVAAMPHETVLVHRDGRRIQVADSAAPIRDAQHSVIGAIIVFRDVSKDYQLDKAKTEFVSLASHQLRTPLSAINWYGEMLLSGDVGALSKPQREYIREIFEGSQRMVALVNSLLDVSRLEVGKLPDKPAPTDMAELVHSIEKELAATTKSKHLTLNLHLHELPLVVADPKQLRMIVQNLMSNAVKYTQAKGAVSVTLRRATAKDLGSAPAQPQLLFMVQDNGYGIPRDQQPHIFEKLFRADNVRVLDVEGTGLGLYIVREVVRKLGGRLWFESEQGKGSTFFVSLPFHARPQHRNDILNTTKKG